MCTKEQFTLLAERYMDMIFRLAYSCLKNKADADDVTQNVLISLYKTDKIFANEDHLRHWLVRVTLNECKMLWRSPWRKTEELTEDYAKTLAFRDERFGDLFAAILALDRKYRAVIVLYYYEGYSISEIAGLLGVPAATVGTRLARAREKLKKELTEVCGDD